MVNRLLGIATTIVAILVVLFMRTSETHVRTAIDNATAALMNLTDRGRGNNGMQYTKACCVCDRFIPYGQERGLTLNHLETVQKCFKPKSIDRAKTSYLVKCYNIQTTPYRFLRKMMLSPRSYKVKIGTKEGLGCCADCFAPTTRLKQDKLAIPTYGICNEWCIGTAPKCLTDLNEVELILVSPARINKHVFSIRAGQHQTIKGWHSLYYNDLSHFEAVEDHVRRLHQSPTISVVLAGPFTVTQKVLALERTTVNWARIDYALQWLKRNNPLYQNFTIDAGNRVQPILVDESTEQEDTTSNVEQVFEYTVCFPDSDEPRSFNAGMNNQEDLMETTLESLAEEDDLDATLIARPTTKLLSDYDGENLMMAFPLQFPYGVGVLDKESNPRTTLKFYKHLLSLSSPNNHRGDFCLVVHNLYERKKMVNNAYLRCDTADGGMAQSFATMEEQDIQGAANRWSNGASGSGIGDLFLKKVEATSMSMAHTNGAARRARQRMFALISALGLPCIFFTVTPDDTFSYRVQIMASDLAGSAELPDPEADVRVLADFQLDCAHLRQKYPGLCATDFSQVLSIVIEHMLGWDRSKRQNKPEEGLFGEVEGWSHAVEEQGRKTLHVHFLLWLKKWSGLLEKLYEPETRVGAVAELKQFMDSVVTTDLTGFTDLKNVLGHGNCTEPKLQSCTPQSLRNLRYKTGCSDFGEEYIVLCEDCGTKFNSEDIAAKTLTGLGIIAATEDLRIQKLRMEVRLMGHLSGETRLPSQDAAQLVGFLRNMHCSKHTKSCFKKDHECRMHCPNQECPETKVHFLPSQTPWFKWDGTGHMRNLFVAEPRRSHADAFVNLHSQHVSEILGCNSNVICGCDGGSCMYMTCYQSKNTQKEDSDRYGRVSQQLIRKMKKEMEERQFRIDNGAGDADDADDYERTRQGISRLIGSVLLCTQAHVVAAPMASFLVRHGSRFGFSHEFAFCDLKAFVRPENNHLSVGSVDGNVFILSYISNYTMRPDSLAQCSLHEFLSAYSVARLSKDSMKFTNEKHPARARQGVNKLKKHRRLPIFNYLDFEDTKKFGGHNILTCVLEDAEGPSVANVDAMEEYAKNVMILFRPFRNIEDLKENGTYLEGFRVHHNTFLFTAVLRKLQNIQDCRNSLNSGRPNDPLEMSTRALPKPSKGSAANDNDVNDNDDDDEAALSSLMNELMEDATIRPAILTELRDRDGRLTCSTRHIRKLGSNQSGYKLLRKPTTTGGSAIRSTMSGINDQSSQQTGSDNTSRRRTSKLDLFTLSLKRVTRKVGDTGTTINATGTAESIKKWAEHKYKDDSGNDCALDKDQQRAFSVIMSNFVLQFHYEADQDNDFEEESLVEAEADDEEGCHNISERRKRIKLSNNTGELRRVCGLREGSKQLLCFLTGAGGSGKSAVIERVKSYGKMFCENLGQRFTKRTIVVTALTGTAAVTIGGETTHKACCLYSNPENMIEQVTEWKQSYLLIVDEISFASKDILEKVHARLNILRESEPGAKFGGICIVFAGDFSQLPPVKAAPLYTIEDLEMWHEWVNTLLELNGNHRYKDDEEWGQILQMFRKSGPTPAQLARINQRVIDPIGNPDGPTENDIPDNATYAVATNIDRNAINDGIFSLHLEHTHHMKHPSEGCEYFVPDHTIIIKGSDLEWKKPGKGRLYAPFNKLAKDILFNYCGDAHVTDSQGSRKVDPFLKLYVGRPLMMNVNKDVSACEANGTTCQFRGIRFNQGVTVDDTELVRVDGYWVRSVCVSQLQCIVVYNEESKTEIDVEATKQTCLVRFPLLGILGMSGTDKVRLSQRIKITQFPFNCCNATTCHKLQGATKECLVIHSFRYTDNWPYVVLSRVRKRTGVFLKRPLDGRKVKGMSSTLKCFLQTWRNEKSPAPVCDPGPYERQYN